MKKQTLLFIFFIFTTKIITAQQQDFKQLYQFENNTSTYVYNDTVNVRLEPSLRATITDTLLAGIEVFIQEKIDSTLQVGYKIAPWYKIKYPKNSSTKYGYIWGGVLSIKAMRRGNVKFMYALKSNTKAAAKLQGQYNAIAEIKVLQADTLKQLTAFNVYYESLAYNSAQILKPAGLAGIQHILAITFSGEACGVPTLTQMAAWNGSKLIMLPELNSVSDAGVFYSDQYFIFPGNKKGIKNTLQLVTDGAEILENEKEKKSYSVKKYSWNGTAFVKK
jgi:hypothetical protein